MTSGPITRLGLADESHEHRHGRIRHGIIGAVFQQAPQAALVGALGGAAVVAVTWGSGYRTAVLGWLAAMMIETAMRLRVAGDYAIRGPAEAAGADPDVAATAWIRRWFASAVIAGALWGLAGMFFFPSSPVLQLILVAAILGVVFGSLSQLSSYAPALFAYLPLALLPLAVRLWAEQAPVYSTAATIVAAILGATLYLGRNYGRTVAESVKAGIDNEILLNQLISEKRIAEDARRAAEAATRSKTRFFAAASHDLRQPLQAIGIYCSLLRKRAQGPIVPLVRNLSAGVETLSNLVGELLEVSRLDAGAIQPRIESVSLTELFTGLQREFQPLAEARRLEFRVRATNLCVTSDSLLLSRVLRNLLGNAIRYTAHGGVLLAARRRTGDIVDLEVWDTGPGIHKQDLDRIFDEFYRGESSKGAADGSAGGFGLGLSIVRRICGVLGHALTVRTRPGFGSMFRVQVPFSALLSPPRNEPEQLPESAIQPIVGVCILLFEDNEGILNSLARLLRSWGADVISATSFTGAVVKRLGHDCRVDLIIADQNLGGPIDGSEAAFRVRELVGVPLPVILLTAMSPMDVLAEFHYQMRRRLESNPQAAAAIARSRVEEPIVLTKPANAALLNARILAALGIRPLDPETLARARAQEVAEGWEDRIL